MDSMFVIWSVNNSNTLRSIIHFLWITVTWVKPAPSPLFLWRVRFCAPVCQRNNCVKKQLNHVYRLFWISHQFQHILLIASIFPMSGNSNCSVDTLQSCQVVWANFSAQDLFEIFHFFLLFSFQSYCQLFFFTFGILGMTNTTGRGIYIYI